MKRIIDINELRKIQLDILSYVDAFCRENDIKYSISGGTLLGAVRHGGYIPWDDDIDIMMRREDYGQFIEKFKRANTSHYQLYTLEDETSFTQPYANVSDTRTLIRENCMPKGMGVNIDIFPIDTITDNPQKRKLTLRKAKFARNKYIIKGLKWENKRNIFKNIFILLGHLFLFGLSYRKLSQNIVEIAQCAGDENSNSRACLVWGYGEKEIVPREVLEKYLDIKFEDRSYMAISDYDTYLSCLFGDYMQLPPLEKQVSHHELEAWWK